MYDVPAGCVEITSDNVQEVLAGADMLGLEGVVEACCNYLQQQLHPANCIGNGWAPYGCGSHGLHSAVVGVMQ